MNALPRTPYARPTRVRPTPASFDSHIITSCGKLGCRGHREARPPAPPPSSGVEIPSPRPAAKPMDSVERVSHNIDQLALSGRRPLLTARQRRQLDRMARRHPNA